MSEILILLRLMECRIRGDNKTEITISIISLVSQPLTHFREALIIGLKELSSKGPDLPTGEGSINNGYGT